MWVLKTLLACAVMACLISVLFASVAQALPTGEASLPVSQVFTNHSSTPDIDTTFSYRLTPEDASDPLPAGSDASGYTFTLTGNDQTSIKIDFAKVGVYTYTLQDVTEARSGYTRDSEIYTVEFYITNDQDPLVVVYLGNGEKAPTVAFDPSYQAVLPAGKVEVAGTKTWDYGNAAKKGRPNSITVFIRNGNKTVKEIKVTAAEGWKWSVLLPKNGVDNKPITYTIDEANVPHYTHKVNGYDLLNTYVSPNYPGDLPKTGDSVKLLAGVFVASVAIGALIIALATRKRPQRAQFNK